MLTLDDNPQIRDFLLTGASLFIAAVFAVCLLGSLGVNTPFAVIGPPPLVYHSHLGVIWLKFFLCYAGFLFVVYALRRDWLMLDGRRFLPSMLLVFVPCFVLYATNGYIIHPGDTTHNVLLPQYLLHGGSFPVAQDFVDEFGNWGLLKLNTGYVSIWPIGTAVFCLPTAVLQCLFGVTPNMLSADYNQRVASAWTAALGVVFLFHCLCLSGTRCWLALVLAAGFAFGSTQTNIAAVGMWQHGPAVLLLCLGLWCLLKRYGPGEGGAAALPLSLLAFVRPQSVLFGLAGFVTAAGRGTRAALWYVLFSLPCGLALICFNLHYFGNLVGGYGYLKEVGNFDYSLTKGFLGLFFSPNRGVFAFSPFLLFALPGLWSLRRRPDTLLLSFTVASLLYLLPYIKVAGWWGGWCIGARYCSELVPLLTLLSAKWLNENRRLLTNLLLAFLLIISIAISSTTARYAYEAEQWNVFPNIDRHLQRVWDYHDWLPLYFTHQLRFERFQEVPARIFVADESLEFEESPSLRYRVRVPLAEKARRVLFVPPVFLKRGDYVLKLKGENRGSGKLRLPLKLEFVYQKFQDAELELPPSKEFVAEYYIQVNQSTWVSVEVMAAGQGEAVFDTVQLEKIALP